MRLPHDLRTATFLARLNRFVVLVDLEGAQVEAHLANSGRLRELLQPGRRVYLASVARAGRRTQYDLQLMQVGKTLVSADARLPNALVEEALLAGRLPEFAGCGAVRREVRYGDSRIDFSLTGSAGQCLVEVKSVTLVVRRGGLFPDAPTERGRRHLQALVAAKDSGQRAAVVFVIQRPDVRSFAPHDAADPAFGQALRRAWRNGVEVYAYRCRVTPEEIAIVGRVPVRLQPGDS